MSGLYRRVARLTAHSLKFCRCATCGRHLNENDRNSRLGSLVVLFPIVHNRLMAYNSSIPSKLGHIDPTKKSSQKQRVSNVGFS